jgi:hypothetical protein
LRNKIGPNKLPISLIDKYITCASLEEVLAQRADCHNIIENQKNIAKSLIKKYNITDTSISWITENPATQINYSFNPIIEEPDKWYAQYYISPPDTETISKCINNECNNDK